MCSTVTSRSYSALRGARLGEGEGVALAHERPRARSTSSRASAAVEDLLLARDLARHDVHGGDLSFECADCGNRPNSLPCAPPETRS